MYKTLTIRLLSTRRVMGRPRPEPEKASSSPFICLNFVFMPKQRNPASMTYVGRNCLYILNISQLQAERERSKNGLSR
ncbi:hypothetical protein SCA6_010255 [Theobroma cacao]